MLTDIRQRWFVGKQDSWMPFGRPLRRVERWVQALISDLYPKYTELCCLLDSDSPLR